MKVFSITNRNSENSEIFLIGNFTTIMGIGVRRGQKLNTLLGNNYPKECFMQNNKIK